MFVRLLVPETRLTEVEIVTLAALVARTGDRQRVASVTSTEQTCASKL